MNKIRLLTFFTGSMLVLIGLGKMTSAYFAGVDGAFYTPLVLIFIGGVLMFAVRRK